MNEFSDFVFYADESGDHSLSHIDSSYPIFCLALCAFEKRAYASRVVPRFQAFKFRYFGHDAVVLHEREIRKQLGDFRILIDPGVQQQFNSELAAMVSQAPFRIFPCVIDKRRISAELFPEHPYHVSLKVCLQGAYRFLQGKGQERLVTHFIFEKRGEKEDKELELEFLRIVSGMNDIGEQFPGFRIVAADKRTNSTGMQIADLVARPLGLHILRPNQPNRAFDAFHTKLAGDLKKGYLMRGIYVPQKRKASDRSKA